MTGEGVGTRSYRLLTTAGGHSRGSTLARVADRERAESTWHWAVDPRLAPQGCLDAVDRLWDKQGERIRESERAQAAGAWAYARATYRWIIEQS